MTILGYRRSDAGDWLTEIGEAEAPAILFIPALFEEMNRTRALTVAVMRGLATRGYRSLLVDLPGTGESERDLSGVAWREWRHAVAALESAAIATASMRGGCLLDDPASKPAWRFSPVVGGSLARDMHRAALAGGAENAGFPIAPDLLAALTEAKPASGEARTVRLVSDAHPADRRVDGPALWRRSEPGQSAPLADLLVEDIASWAAKCAA